MKKQPDKKTAKVSYKDKTNFPGGSGVAFVEYLNKADVKKIINEALKINGSIDEDRIHAELNRVISFLSHTNFIKLIPGKADKKAIIKKICALSADLENHLKILLDRYGYDTYKHVPIFIHGQMSKPYDFLSGLAERLHSLSIVDEMAIKSIDSASGKKTGNNEKNAVPNLIYYLAKLYEEYTQKKARENFQQDPAGHSPFKGQFYDFVCSVFEVLNKKGEIFSPGSNPFKIDFVNKHGDVSASLGKYVRQVFSRTSEF